MFDEFREKRQDLYDINQFKLIPYEFNGKKKKVYSNVNFSIFTDDYCNANCGFCVAQLRFENRGKLYEKSKIKSDDEYLTALRKVLEAIRPLNPSVSITGGEPTMCKRLVPILEMLKELDFRKKTITTNGSGLLNRVDGKTILQHLINNKFQHLNISRAHYDEDINRKIMNYDKGYCSNKDIEEIVKEAKSNGLRPRLSCILLKEDGIGNTKEIKKYLEFYRNLGLDNIIFRELMDYDDKIIINNEKKMFCERNKAKLNNIWRELDNYSELQPVKNILGYYYYVEVYKYKNVDFVMESADLKRLYIEKKRYKDNVYEMIFHPNGYLNGSWVDNEDILIPYEGATDRFN